MHAAFIEEQIPRAAEAIREATALLITAGAGMGVDSGLPDFRGTDGFWKAYPALAKLGVRFEQMSHPRWFERSPELAWAFYGYRLKRHWIGAQRRRRNRPHLRAIDGGQPEITFSDISLRQFR
jgi:hypothetical protein